MNYKNPVTELPSITVLSESIYHGEPYLPKNKTWDDETLYDNECYKHVMNIRENLRMILPEEEFASEAALARVFETNGYSALDFFANLLGDYHAMLLMHKCTLSVPTMDENHAHFIHALYKWSEVDDEMPGCVFDKEERLLDVNGTWFKVVNTGHNRSQHPEDQACTILHEAFKTKTYEFQRMLEQHYDIKISSLPGFLASFTPNHKLPEHVIKCNECITTRMDYVLECIKYLRKDGKVLVHADLANIMTTIRNALRKGRIEWNRVRRR